MVQKEAVQTVRQLQAKISDIYGLTDDRMYSLFDLLTQVQRFTMRALKGIRTDDHDKLRSNLLIACAWLFAIANRLHIDVEDALWERFPAVCSYCGLAVCECRRIRLKRRIRVKMDPSYRPRTIADFQAMFRRIYPPEKRTLAEAGVHLAEETGEISEAVHNFLGQHMPKQFEEIRFEIADYLSLIFGVANSSDIDVAIELNAMFKDGCHACGKTPCVCTFPEVAAYQS